MVKVKTFGFLSHVLPDRSIVRERRPSFDGSFVETCLRLAGKISGVWGRLGGGVEAGGHPVPVPAAETACFLDMLLVPAGCHAPRALASAREAFRLVCLLRGACLKA